jgi:hypothetical protein
MQKRLFELGELRVKMGEERLVKHAEVTKAKERLRQAEEDLRALQKKRVEAQNEYEDLAQKDVAAGHAWRCGCRMVNDLKDEICVYCKSAKNKPRRALP